MEDRTLFILAEYIAELRRRDRNSYRAAERNPHYPEEDYDTNGVQGNGSGDERCDTNTAGQSRNNISG